MDDVPEPSCNKTSEYVCDAGLAVIVIPALLCVTTAAIVTLIVRSLYCKRCLQEGDSPVASSTVSASLSLAPNALSPWQIPKDCALEGLELLQAGHYGAVCKSQLRRGDVTTAVIIKTFQGSSSEPRAWEFVAWAHFHTMVCRHDNLVRMLFCQTQRLPMFLVLEASSPGNLLQFLWTLRKRDVIKQDQSVHFSERSVYFVAKQVSNGLYYLSSKHSLVHGDVAARNILIGDGLSVKVTGLGIAFEMKQTGKVAKRRTLEVPVKWKSPESILQLPLTEKSDVWSFGILLYELITLGSPPYPELEPSEVFPYIQRSYRMRKPESCGSPLYDLMKYCWMWDIQDRPHFSSVIKLLDSYAYLADTRMLLASDKMDITEYKKKAGFLC